MTENQMLEDGTANENVEPMVLTELEANLLDLNAKLTAWENEANVSHGDDLPWGERAERVFLNFMNKAHHELEKEKKKVQYLDEVLITLVNEIVTEYEAYKLILASITLEENEYDRDSRLKGLNLIMNERLQSLRGKKKQVGLDPSTGKYFFVNHIDSEF